MKLYCLALAIAAVPIFGCNSAKPTHFVNSRPSRETIPPVTQEEQYRQEFYNAFNSDGLNGLTLYFISFSWTDDTERKAVCDAVHSGGWHYARTQLSESRFEEFKRILAQAGYTTTFPTGKELFKIGREAYLQSNN